MRKYQQLILVAISIISIATLLLYRSENGRLKYVLDVVNIFGQQTDLLHKADDHPSYEYTTPFPIWQRIGKGFHAYSAFWHWDPAGGGQITAIVVGLQHSIVRFRCDVTGGSGAEPIVAGRFGFNREELPAVDLPLDTAHRAATAGDDYIVYKFLCTVPNIRAAPSRVSFTELDTNRPHTIGVRDLTAAAAVVASRPKDGTNTVPAPVARQSMVACVNLISPLTASLRQYFYAGDALAQRHLLEFFYHHSVIGVEEFIVYDDSDRVPLAAKQNLAAHSVRVNYLPFNFPFTLGAATQADDPRVRHILQLDCELRTLNVAQWFVVAQPNEMMYVDAFLQAPNSTIRMLQRGDAGAQRTSYELATNTVCLSPKKNSETTTTIDSNVYVATAEDVVRTPGSAAVASNYQLSRPTLARTAFESSMRMPAVRMLVNRYVECVSMDLNSEVTHNTWPATIEPQAAQAFMRFIGLVDHEVLRMLAKTVVA